MKPALQVVHESETQRQHVRYPVPARVTIDGAEYAIKDLSAGGLAVCDITGEYNRGQRVAMQLVFPFDIFALHLNCEGEVLYYSAEKKLLGCKLVNLDAQQVNMLSHTLRSFQAGEIVEAGGILNVAARNNFTKPRNQTATSAPNIRRQIPGLLAVLAFGLAISGFVLSNVYSSLFIVKAADAAVTTATQVTAAIEPMDVARLVPDAKAEITVFGAAQSFTGHLESLQSGMNTVGGRAVATVAMDQELPPELAGRPASVTFKR